MAVKTKYSIFAREYVKDCNGTRAAVAAGFSAKSAHVTATRLLKNAKVQAEIAKLQQKIEQKLDLSVERLFEELGRIALLDPANFYGADGNLIPIPQLTEDARRALAGMDIEEAYEHFGKGQAKPVGQVKKIKFWDKGLAIERLLRYKHRIGDKVEISGLEGLADRIQKARKKVS